jgi:hypothetical protein
MRPSTEDLLAVRDSEPLDARAKAVIESSLAHGRAVERLRRVQNALRALPALEPPADVLARVLEAKDAREVGRTRWLRFAAGAGVAAAVATAAIVYVTTSGQSRQPEVAPVTLVASGEPNAPHFTATPVSYVSLVEQSGRLDQLLAELPAQRPLMTGATASTIAGLEDRIAFLDEQLAFSAAGKVPVPQRAALWSDRVELMNALVSVRYAEAQMNGF